MTMYKVELCVWIFSFACMHCNCQTTTLTPAVADVIEGSDVTLVCHVSTAVVYTAWKLNSGTSSVMVNQDGKCSVHGSILTDTNKYAYVCNQTVYQLTIHDVQRSQHNDMWTCTAQGQSDGSDSVIKVKVPITSVSITPPTSTVDIEEYHSKQFTCITSEGRPAGSVSWYKLESGVQSQINQNTTATQNTNDIGFIVTTSVLRFVPTREENGIKIYCEAGNTANTNTVKSSEKQVNVLYKAMSPNIAEGSEYRVLENIQGQLHCRIVGGNPTPSLTWNCNSWSSSRSNVGETVTQTLSWTTARGQDRTCTCTSQQSGFLDKSVSINVVILYKAEIMSFDVVGYDGKDAIIVDERADMTLKCNVESNPTSKVTLTAPTGFTYDISDLLLYTRRAVECLDAGIYLCAASNKYNDGIEAYTILQIIVRCSPRPEFDVDVNRTAIEQESFTFAFTASAYPVPSFKWLKFSENIWSELRNNNDNIHISTSGLEANLTILQVASEDYGQYKLVLTNEIGSFEQLFRLTRPDLPDTPMNFRQLQAFTTQSTIKLAWEPGFDGGLTQSFDIRYKTDSEQLWRNDRAFDNSEATMNYTLTGLESETKYNIIIYALNRVGKSLESRMIASTKAKETDFSTGIVIGAAIGGIIVGVILSVVVICAARRFGRGILCVNTVKKQESFENNPQNTSVEDENNGDHDTIGASEYEHIGERSRSEVYTTLESDPGKLHYKS